MPVAHCPRCEYEDFVESRSSMSTRCDYCGQGMRYFESDEKFSHRFQKGSVRADNSRHVRFHSPNIDESRRSRNCGNERFLAQETPVQADISQTEEIVRIEGRLYRKIPVSDQEVHRMAQQNVHSSQCHLIDNNQTRRWQSRRPSKEKETSPADEDPADSRVKEPNTFCLTHHIDGHWDQEDCGNDDFRVAILPAINIEWKGPSQIDRLTRFDPIISSMVMLFNYLYLIRWRLSGYHAFFQNRDKMFTIIILTMRSRPSISQEIEFQFCLFMARANRACYVFVRNIGKVLRKSIRKVANSVLRHSNVLQVHGIDESTWDDLPLLFGCLYWLESLDKMAVPFEAEQVELCEDRIANRVQTYRRETTKLSTEIHGYLDYISGVVDSETYRYLSKVFLAITSAQIDVPIATSLFGYAKLKWPSLKDTWDNCVSDGRNTLSNVIMDMQFYRDDDPYYGMANKSETDEGICGTLPSGRNAIIDDVGDGEEIGDVADSPNIEPITT